MIGETMQEATARLEGPYFHVGIVVDDIEAAMRLLGPTLGLTWKPAHVSRYGESRITVCYSREGPPFVELIRGVPGGLWDSSGAPRIDHVGYWSEDLEADRARLEAAGLAVDIDGVALGGRFYYHRALDGAMRVELVDVSRRSAILGGG